MKRNFAFIGFLFGALLLAQGCGTVRVADNGSRGIFQRDDGMRTREEMRVSSVGKDFELQRQAGFVWPIHDGRVSSYFGNRRRDYHEGIDIRGSRGTPIHSAQSGKVIYSARRINGYGNMIVIQHDNGFATVYAHNKKNLVRVGDTVERGQVIALLGATGKATGPHLHFEIRKSELPQDPLLYLPESRKLAND